MSYFKYFLAILLVFCLQTTASAYGYGAKDPLILGFKKLKTHLSKQDWKSIEKEIKTLEAQIKNIKKFFGEDLQKDFDEAVSSKDRKMLANTWVKLTAQTCRLHLWWNLQEGLKDEKAVMKRCKSRVDSVNRLLKDILGAPIKANSPERHKKIALVVANLRECLGSPGIFGAAKVAPDAVKFLEKSLEFDDLLFKSFSHLKPEWVKNMSESKAKEMANTHLNSLKTAKDFNTRFIELSKALTALNVSKVKDWKKTFVKLYPLMGAPSEGKKSERAAHADFSKTIDALINILKK